MKTEHYTQNKEVRIIQLNNIGEFKWKNDGVKYTTYEHSKTIERCITYPQDIVIAKMMPAGRAIIVPDTDSIYVISSDCVRLRVANEFYNKYIMYAINCSIVKQQVFDSVHGIGRSRTSLSKCKELLLPIPPHKIQKEICNVIDMIFKLSVQIEEKNIEVAHLAKASKSKILDLAIRGKLVPQNQDDEPASVLLERIRAQKEELIKQGKIKRDKKESIIFKGDDNSYYEDLPSGWCVSTLGSLTTSSCLNDGDWILSDNMVKFGNIKLIQLGSVGFMKYIDKGFKYLTDETFEELGCTEIHSGYMLINRIVSDKMSACILPKIDGKKITTVDTCWISPCDNWYNLKYLLYAISSPQFQSSVMLNSSGTTRKRISKLNLISLPLVIPPLEEQKRIVDAIETAFEQLDNILNSI